MALGLDERGALDVELRPGEGPVRTELRVQLRDMHDRDVRVGRRWILDEDDALAQRRRAGAERDEESAVRRHEHGLEIELLLLVPARDVELPRALSGERNIGDGSARGIDEGEETRVVLDDGQAPSR